MQDFLRTIIAGIAGGVLLNWFYAVLQSKWPDSYYAISSLVDEGISHSSLRYALFRLLPPYTIGVLVASFAIRFTFSIAWAIAVCGVIHLSATNGTALVRGIKSKEMSPRASIAHLATIAMSTIALIFAGFSARWWYPYTPGPDKYMEVALTGIVAAAVVFQMQRATQHRFDASAAVTDFRAHIDRDLIAHMEQECVRYQVDPDLMLAVLITEDKQRPDWFRRAEKLAGRFGFKGTFGIAQSSRDWRASDQQSITEAAKNLAGALASDDGGSWAHGAPLRYQLERHNKGATFIEFASEVYNAISSGYRARSQKKEPHGAISLRVFSYERIEDRWHISGDIADRFKHMVAASELQQLPSGFALDKTDSGLRTKWSTTIPISINRLRITGREVSDTGTEADQVSVDLYLY
ncbi:hypothetical protein [Lentzea sp. NPDC051838]|uniref:hypothetical protein n=1 Tax=Lentzea sp. NPDC051838 TaxID=3154849 RepID=UPI00343A01B6